MINKICTWFVTVFQYPVTHSNRTVTHCHSYAAGFQCTTLIEQSDVPQQNSAEILSHDQAYWALQKAMPVHTSKYANGLILATIMSVVGIEPLAARFNVTCATAVTINGTWGNIAP